MPPTDLEPDRRDAEAAWMLDVRLRRHAAQAAELWQFVCEEAGDNEGRREQLLLRLFRMAREGRTS